MDMKQILQAFNGAAAKKPVAGASDMKKFLSIVVEGKVEKSVEETVISSFEAGTVGGDANDFLLAADKIQDEVMAQINKIKINADEALLRDMMDKFNSFMTSYHAVGKDILQPDMFNDSMGEDVDEAYGRRRGSYGYNPERDAQSQWNAYQRGEQDFRNRERNAGVEHEDDPEWQRAQREKDRGPWYLKINGKIYKQKGIPKSFDWKSGASKYGMAILKNNPGAKIFLTKKAEDDLPPEPKQEGLSFKDYVSLEEAKKKITKKEDPCWNGYHMVGTKNKGGREVPNCVPGKKG